MMDARFPEQCMNTTNTNTNVALMAGTQINTMRHTKHRSIGRTQQHNDRGLEHVRVERIHLYTIKTSVKQIKLIEMRRNE